MKKILIIVFVSCLVSLSLCAETIKGHYNLYSTSNMYMFLKLDTRSGEIWQVQWNTDPNNIIAVVLSSEKLSNDSKDGRFELFPTTNIYTFLLLDKIDGRTWQVQWSTEKENRLLIPIKDLASID